MLKVIFVLFLLSSPLLAASHSREQVGECLATTSRPAVATHGWEHSGGRRVIVAGDEWRALGCWVMGDRHRDSGPRVMGDRRRASSDCASVVARRCIYRLCDGRQFSRKKKEEKEEEKEEGRRKKKKRRGVGGEEDREIMVRK